MPLTHITAALALTAAAALAGAALGTLAQRLSHRTPAATRFTEQINDCLPQLQCGDCGYPGCRPYAAAIAAGTAAITLCPPGGPDTVQRLATLLGTDPTPIPTPPPQRTAYIITEDCVGCALCLPACPTDAILGAPRGIHTVATEHCVGCELCLPPCPTDCIRMLTPEQLAHQTQHPHQQPPPHAR